MPLQRYAPHDGLAVVNQPDGYGLHIFLETDTSDPAICRPRWLPDPARLFNGNGTTRSVPVWRPVRSSLRRWHARTYAGSAAGVGSPLPAACSRCPMGLERATAIGSGGGSVRLPALEQGELLTNPVDELERVEALLRNQPAAE